MKTKQIKFKNGSIIEFGKVKDRLSGLEKGLENVEERTVKLEKRMGEHDYFHSKQNKSKEDWCTCKEPIGIDSKDRCLDCHKKYQPKEDTKELREKILETVGEYDLSDRAVENLTTDIMDLVNE